MTMTLQGSCARIAHLHGCQASCSSSLASNLPHLQPSKDINIVQTKVSYGSLWKRSSGGRGFETWNAHRHGWLTSDGSLPGLLVIARGGRGGRESSSYNSGEHKGSSGSGQSLDKSGQRNSRPGDSKNDRSQKGQGRSTSRQPQDVEQALAARLGPTRGTWLQEIGKDKSQADAMGTMCLYIKRNIRQYEEITYEGSVVVFGDVGGGSIIRAGGDVVVLGRLTGEVHAGMRGDRKAAVLALAMEPATIAIANEIVSGPEGAAQPHPEIASVSQQGSISIEPVLSLRMGRGQGEVPEAGSRVEETLQQLAARQQHPEVRWTSVEPEGAAGPTPGPRQSRRAAQVARVTGAYITVAGLAVIAFPQTVFGLLFDPQAMTRGWIQVLGVLCLMFGIYYFGAAQGDLQGRGARGFYLSTVFGRTVLFFAFCGLVATGAVQISLLVLASVNLLGALSMLLALRAQPQS